MLNQEVTFERLPYVTVLYLGIEKSDCRKE